MSTTSLLEAPSRTSLDAPSVRPNKKNEETPMKNSKPSNEAPVEPPKKRGRPSNAELAERSRNAKNAENQLKDRLNSEIARGVLESEEIKYSSYALDFFYKNGQSIKWQTAIGEWEEGHVIRHPVEMPDMVRVLYGNGYEEWKAAKNLKLVR